MTENLARQANLRSDILLFSGFVQWAARSQDTALTILGGLHHQYARMYGFGKGSELARFSEEIHVQSPMEMTNVALLVM